MSECVLDKDGNCVDEEKCQACCPHDDLDHCICLACERDLSETIFSRAYDRAKDFRKYGDT